MELINRPFIATLKVATLVALLLVSACSSQPVKPTSLSGSGEFPVTVEETLALARESDSPRSEELLLHAVELLHGQQKYPEAQTLLDSIFYQGLPQNLKGRYVILWVKIAVATQKLDEAMEALTTNQFDLYNFYDFLPTAMQVELNRLKSVIYEQQGNYLAAARERIFFGPLLNEESVKDNNEAIWRNLMQLPLETLKEFSEKPGSLDLQGWAELAYLNKANQDNLDLQVTLINNWIQQWPNHEANRFLPGDIQALSKAALEQPKQVAILLPSEGKFKTPAQVILDGFLAMHYFAKEQGRTVPLLKFYDTSFTPIDELYDQAVADGAEVVIGPLSKENVEKLASREELPVNTLALNYTEDLTDRPPTKDLFQFGLNIKDEIHQVADRAWRDGFQQAAVIYPESSWGNRAFTDFVDAWLEEGGKIVAESGFEKGKGFSDPVKVMLNVDQSQERARQIRSIIGERVEFNPRRRQDIDYIFLLGTPQEARQIIPTLHFHYAEDLPLYGTSRVYGGEPNPQLDKDLNGLLFVDSPWHLGTTNPIKRYSDKSFPNMNGELSRLQGLGIDAYKLYPRLNILKAVKTGAVFGVSGSLSLNDSQQIQRELLWAQIQNGVPKLMPKTVERDEQPDLR